MVFVWIIFGHYQPPIENQPTVRAGRRGIQPAVRAGRRGNHPRHNQPTSARAVSPHYRPASWARQAGRTSLVNARIVARLSRPYITYTTHTSVWAGQRGIQPAVRAGRRGIQPRHNQPTSARAV
jgi:hypothetical protein